MWMIKVKDKKVVKKMVSKLIGKRLVVAQVSNLEDMNKPMVRKADIVSENL